MKVDFSWLRRLKRDTTAQGYVWNNEYHTTQHRVVAFEILGRWLGKEETIHHINYHKQDNRPENLIVLHENIHIMLTIYHKWRDYNHSAKRVEPTLKPKGLLKFLSDAAIPYIYLGEPNARRTTEL